MFVRESEIRTLVVGWWWGPIVYVSMTMLMLGLPLVGISWLSAGAFVALLILSLPGWFTIRIDNDGVMLRRGWLFIPVWRKRMGLECTLDRYWSWDGPFDDGIAFSESGSSEYHQFGSVRTCERLYLPLRAALTRHRARRGLPSEDFPLLSSRR